MLGWECVVGKHRLEDRDAAAAARAVLRDDSEAEPTPEGTLLGIVVLFGWLAAMLCTGDWGVLVAMLGFMMIFIWGAIERRRRGRRALRRRAKRVALIRAGRPPDHVTVPRRVLRVFARVVLGVFWGVAGLAFVGSLLGFPIFLAVSWFGPWGIAAGLPFGALLLWVWTRFAAAHPGAVAGVGAGAVIGTGAGA